MENYNLCIQVIAMPCNTNANGDIFGGWLMSQMDLAGSVECKRNCPGRYVTITVDKMIFSKPVKVGDLLSIYCEIKTIGKSSITIDIIAQIKKSLTNEIIYVTEGIFKYVHIDNNNKPKSIISLKN
jgi:acyl-CoA thioesterase YciA